MRHRNVVRSGRRWVHTDMTTRTGAATETLREQVVEAVSEVKPRLRGWLHAGAAPLALAGGVLLVKSSPPGSPRTGSTVFAACALVLFTVSAAMHRGRWSPRANLVLTRLDHACIFLLIAGGTTRRSRCCCSAGRTGR